MPIRQQEWQIPVAGDCQLFLAEKRREAASPGQAVLLIHGSGVGHGGWNLEIGDYGVMDFLAQEGFDVFAVDQRGYGRSTKPEDGRTVRAETSAHDLRAVLDFIKKQTRVERVHIVGHSSGAVVAVLLAAKCPGDIGRMVLMGFAYKTVHPRFRPVVEQIIGLAHAGAPYVPNRHHLDIEQRLFSYEEQVVDTYRRLIAETYPQMPAGVFLDLESHEYALHVPHVRAPTLLVNGDSEYVVDADDAAQCLEDLGAQEKELLVVPDAYHLLFLEKAAHGRVNRTVSDWLSR